MAQKKKSAKRFEIINLNSVTDEFKKLLLVVAAYDTLKNSIKIAGNFVYIAHDKVTEIMNVMRDLKKSEVEAAKNAVIEAEAATV